MALIVDIGRAVVIRIFVLSIAEYRFARLSQALFSFFLALRVAFNCVSVRLTVANAFALLVDMLRDQFIARRGLVLTVDRVAGWARPCFIASANLMFRVHVCSFVVRFARVNVSENIGTYRTQREEALGRGVLASFPVVVRYRIRFAPGRRFRAGVYLVEFLPDRFIQPRRHLSGAMCRVSIQSRSVTISTSRLDGVDGAISYAAGIVVACSAVEDARFRRICHADRVLRGQFI